MKNLVFWIALLFSCWKVSANDSEKLLVNENFQSWAALSNGTTSVVKTTDFSQETLTYSLKEVTVSPAGRDETRFNYTVVSDGYLMCNKSATTGIELSPLASITRVEFIHGATGGNRGFKLEKKIGNGDWIVVSSDYATPASGIVVSKDINGENVALRFTNLAPAQNAYLFNLRIYGNYVSSAPQVNLTTSVNLENAGNITRSINSDTYDQGTVVKLTATQNFGYKFEKWTDKQGTTLSTDAVYDIALDEDKEVIAVFQAVQTYNFTVNIDGSKWGNVDLSPKPTNGQYEQGTLVTASIVSNPVTTFSFWEDGSSTTSRVIQVNNDVEITATFDEVPFIVGWDFVAQEPKANRTADYYSESTNTGIMSMHKQDGTVINWLANLGSFSPSYACIRKWAVEADFDSDQRYYQASFSTVGYENIQVNSMMGGNFQIHTKQTMQYSIDGTLFHDLQTIDITSAYNASWVDCNATLPKEAEGQEKVYIRWISDTTSPKMGTGNDGTALTNIFVFADKIFIPDTDAPILLSTSPKEDSATASANGSIVLTFNERVKLGTGNITLSGVVLDAPVFGSKTATFKYSKLTYNTLYTLVVPAGALEDMSGNTFEGITLTFSTMNRPQPITKIFDAVIAADGTGDFTSVQAAIDAAPSNSAVPYLIFVKNGKYKGHVEIPEAKKSIHIIGQSRDGVIITDNRLAGDDGKGTPSYHVSLAATVVVNAPDCYFENITFENSHGYENLAGPQALAMFANNDKIIFKNCWLRSYQDTYLTSTKNIADRQYLQNCRIEGAVDYIYGAGDIFFDQCTLYCNRPAGGYIVAPNHQPATAWGYVFSNCTLDGNSGTITYLGRPWRNSPKTVFINTFSKIDIYASGWYYKMNAIPVIFADYGTTDKNGNPMDLSQRIEDYEYDIKEGDVVIETIKGKAKKSLTDAEATTYTIENVLSGNDAWEPRTKTENTEAPVATADNNKISWTPVDYAICYVIEKNGTVIDFTTNTEYTPTSSADNQQDSYFIYAAAESGSLSNASNEVLFNTDTGINDQIMQQVTCSLTNNSLAVNNLPEKSTVEVYNLQGPKVWGKTNISGDILTTINLPFAIVRISSPEGVRVYKLINQTK